MKKLGASNGMATDIFLQGSLSSNNKHRSQQTALFSVQLSKVHGQGLFAAKVIRAGKVITAMGSSTRCSEEQACQAGYPHDAVVYLAHGSSYLDSSWKIDENPRPPPWYYLNHDANEANALMYLSDANIISWRAARDIAVGDEILYNYHPSGTNPSTCTNCNINAAAGVAATATVVVLTTTTNCTDIIVNISAAIRAALMKTNRHEQQRALEQLVRNQTCEYDKDKVRRMIVNQRVMQQLFSDPQNDPAQQAKKHRQPPRIKMKQDREVSSESEWVPSESE